MTVAFAVDRSATSGAITFASEPDEAAELVTAWHTPPDTPSQEPVECEPRASGETTGSVAVAALATDPVQAISPAQVIAAPAAEAADGPAGSRAAFTCCGPPANASAAPGPLDADETERTSQPPVAPAQDAVPSDVRGVPFATAPSHAVVLVRTEPEHVVPAGHTTLALDDEVEDGPAIGWPATGSPVTGSVTTKSGALDAAELVPPEQPPPVTVHPAVADVPRACGVTPVSCALVDDADVPPHSPIPPLHSTEALAFDTLTGPDTVATAGSEAGSRSATVVSVPPEQVPPAPCTVHDDPAVLLRTPATSPEAAPEVVLHPRPVQVAAAHVARAEAALLAASSRTAMVDALRVAPAASSTREEELLTQPPSVAAQVDAALVSRTGAVPPATAGAPVTFPSVFAPASPEQPRVPPQSTLAAAVLNADFSPSVTPASSTRVSLAPSHSPPRATQLAAPSLARSAPADPLVTAVPLPSQPASQSTSTAAFASASPATLRAEHPPPETVHPALLLVAATVFVGALWSPVVLAAPEHPASQSTSASATTVSSTSTELDVRQLPSQTAAPPPSTRPLSSSTVVAFRTSGSSAPEPLLRLSHDPPPVSQDASDPCRSARVLSPQSPVHRADALVAPPSAPRLDALLPQPESSHDASDFEPPDSDDAPHPDDTPDRHNRRSESFSPSADSLADPHPVNAPSESQPAAEPSPSRSSSDTVDTCRSVASINSSVAS
ncbi:hypothetical protein [Pseudonocardia sp. DLS-67]